MNKLFSYLVGAVCLVVFTMAPGPPGGAPVGSNTDLTVKSVSVGGTNPAAFDVDGDGTAEYILGDTAPAAADSTGTAGTIVISGGYLYFCSATDTWIRVQLATW